VYYFYVIRRFYAHNFRCLENFDLPIAGRSSALLIGKNGAGKTTVALALEILQKIARGRNRVGDLVTSQDLTRGRTADVPIRFEIEVELDGIVYGYGIAFERPKSFKEFRVLDEKFVADGRPVFTREIAKVFLARTTRAKEAEFVVDWHMVALPIIQQESKDDPIFIFKQWLARMLILRPIPALISGESDSETLEPNVQVTDFGAWFTGLLAYAPAAYSYIDSYVRRVMPDIKDIKNPLIGSDSRSLSIQFATPQQTIELSFASLSDGEKCFMICALVLAASNTYAPTFCFWDEPDNYLSISEVADFVIALRRAFQSTGQFLATSHNSETIRCFPRENILLLQRNSHMEPTVVRPVSELQVNGDLVGALIRDDVEP
jgi:predicted ATPase